MKIYIITFHDTFNFGATLQCCALSCYLNANNHNVEVINYIPKYIQNKKSALKEFNSMKNRHGLTGKIKAFLRGIYYYAHINTIKRRDLRYKVFLNKNIQITDFVSSISDLDSFKETDLYICGSDQIWNPVLTGGDFDRAFFLEFAKGRKVAYGVSTGEADLASNGDELRKLTSDFEYISVREKKTAEELSSILNRNVEVVLDPTLLLDAQDYAGMEMPLDEKGPYLLFYNVSPAPLATSTALKIANEKGFRIIDISPSPFVRVPGAKKVDDIGPGEFLSYIKNAECVVTNSFHGTVFSIIYRKSFYSIPHKKRSGRVVDLLELTGLSERLITDSDSVSYKSLDYVSAYESLNEARKKSIDFLQKCLTISNLNEGEQK